MTRMHRIVVSIDIPVRDGADSPVDAYVTLVHALDAVCAQGLFWESTDEWYDLDGEAIPQQDVDQLRLQGQRRLQDAEEE